jgi:hypothetical protein
LPVVAVAVVVKTEMAEAEVVEQGGFLVEL